MKKLLLLIIAAFLAISVIGQSVNGKTRTDAYQKQQDLENLQVFLADVQVLDSTISESWNEISGDYIFASRKKYTYSVIGSTTTTISSIRDLTTSFIWVYSGKTENTVNATGKTTLNVSYTWNKTTSQWVGALKLEFTYDGSGNMTSNSTYTWSTLTSQWAGLAKTDYFYTGGILTSDIGYLWDKTIPIPGWVNSSKTEYTYTGGILTSDLSYDWDKNTNSWGVATGKTVYIYTGGNMASATSSEWDQNTSSWVNSSKSEYTYASGKMTRILVSTWVVNQWINASKMESEYNDPDGRITLNSNYLWDPIGNDWFGFLKNEFSYGVLGPLSYTITLGSGWDLINGGWINAARVTSWYSDQATGINNLSEKDIRVYPNPAKEFVVFDFTFYSESARVEIFNIQGKKVMEQQLSENKQIFVKNLRKGLYIYKLHNSGAVYTGKLLIE